MNCAAEASAAAATVSGFMGIAAAGAARRWGGRALVSRRLDPARVCSPREGSEPLRIASACAAAARLAFDGRPRFFGAGLRSARNSAAATRVFARYRSFLRSRRVSHVMLSLSNASSGWNVRHAWHSRLGTPAHHRERLGVLGAHQRQARVLTRQVFPRVLTVVHEAHPARLALHRRDAARNPSRGLLAECHQRVFRRDLLLGKRRGCGGSRLLHLLLHPLLLDPFILHLFIRRRSLLLLLLLLIHGHGLRLDDLARLELGEGGPGTSFVSVSGRAPRAPSASTAPRSASAAAPASAPSVGPGPVLKNVASHFADGARSATVMGACHAVASSPALAPCQKMTARPTRATPAAPARRRFQSPPGAPGGTRAARARRRQPILAHRHQGRALRPSSASSPTTPRACPRRRRR